MLSLPASVRVFVFRAPVASTVDVDGLFRLARREMAEDPFTGNIFCFFNRKRDRVKLLVWDRNGFWTLCKRLERGRFPCLNSREPCVELTREALVMLLSGINERTGRFRRNFVRDIRMSRRDVVAQRARPSQ